MFRATRMPTKSIRNVQKLSSEELANALYLDLLNQHKLANLTRKFKKSEWLAAMATALNTLKASAPVSK